MQEGGGFWEAQDNGAIYKSFNTGVGADPDLLWVN